MPSPSSPAPSRRRLPDSWRTPFALLALLAVPIALGLACALPGRPERVLPEITGAVAGNPADGHRARLTLVVIHSRTPSVHDRRETVLSPDQGFRFEPLLLDVAGREFGHHYRVYLHYTKGGNDRVIWRAQISRVEDATPIRLDCDLARPIALGEPCRVVDPLAQPWLLDEGKRHFARLCADCHGRDARGSAGESARRGHPALAGVPDLTRIASRHGGRFDPDVVAAWIEGRSVPDEHVRGAMPVWGERLSSEFERYADGDELVGATLDPIVAYLESLQRRD